MKGKHVGTVCTACVLLGAAGVLLDFFGCQGWWHHGELLPLAVGVCCTAAAVVLWVLLRQWAVRQQELPEWVEKLPCDFIFLVYLFLMFLELDRLSDWAQWAGWFGYVDDDIVPAILLALLLAAGSVAVLLLIAVRRKGRTLYRHTAAAWCARKGVTFFRQLPMIWRVVALFVLYLAGEAALILLSVAVGTLGLMLFLLLVYQVPMLYLLCRWTVQWRAIRAVTGRIVAGNLNAQVDHRSFFPDLREHAMQLNELGQAIDQAVEERLKSERFKAELITNVSHDLKTPLTSIVSYVDLLKKEELDSPAAREYVQVLERKSQQLKKLTEDLIEASKASTGAVTVSRERLDLAQLARQAVGEYEPRLKQAGLTAVVNVPEQPLLISADGRHMGQVLDNLLGNCVKYALAGTRVYVDVLQQEDRAVLTVKNVSRQPLNIPPEQLMERFVRGDESRTTEGSGLGLSIARSLTELQQGAFSLSIDGDLFKAAMTFPLLEEKTESADKTV